jgi:hypothetical protein
LFLIPKNSIFAVSPSVAIALQAPNTRKLPIEMISHNFQLFFAYFWQSKAHGNVPDLLDIQAEASKLSIHVRISECKVIQNVFSNHPAIHWSDLEYDSIVNSALTIS